MAKTFALVFGAVYLLVGILGLILPNPLLGIFGVNTLHNVVHLLIGAAWLVAATAAPMGENSSRVVSQVIGVVLVLLAIVGFVAPQTLKDLITAGYDPMADNILHLVTGALALYIGFGTRAELARA